MQILIIRPGAIGDTLLTLPVIQALRARDQVAHIILVGNVAVLPLALASGIVDAVADYEQLQWSELFSSVGIRSPAMLSLLQQSELVICLLRDSDGVVCHNLQQAGVKHLIIAAGRPPEGQRIHIVQYLLETVGLPFDTIDLTNWQLPLKQQDSLLDVGKQPIIAIHPGSGGARKCWPVVSFAEVIERLWQHSYSVLLLAGPADAERTNYLRQHLASPPEQTILTVLVDAPLLGVAQHLQQCQRYLGNDSGITHLAGMLGIRTVAIFGPSDPTIWRPVGPDVEIIEVAELAQLPVEMILNALY